MGCSPSKGQLFSKKEPGTEGLLPALKDNPISSPVEDESKCLEIEEKENAPELEEEGGLKNEPGWCQLASDNTNPEDPGCLREDFKEIQKNVIPQEIISNALQTDKPTMMEKRKKSKAKRRFSEKKRKSSIVPAKVDFSPHMVRAHQAAYAFLNPNISKYETLLGLLDQAAQTQLSLQPMMSAFILHFEEINQALEEMAEEGELMLREHKDYMALPSGMLGAASLSAKPSTDTANTPDPPPDLLQQLLQHSTDKMRQVGIYVQAVGDTTLEEAVEYFSSLSKLLVVKLQAKQAAEQRLAQVLVQVEGAAMGKTNPEDVSLHSEDSGIGGENESLTGSERHHRHRGSAGSGSCGFGVNVRGAFDNTNPNLPNLTDRSEEDEEDEDEEEDEDDADECEDYESDRFVRKRSNSSPPDPSQSLCYIHDNYLKGQQFTVKRPLTAVSAVKPNLSVSNRCVNILMDFQKTQLDMKNLEEMQGNEKLAGTHNNSYRARLRRHSINGSVNAYKGPLRTIQPSCPLPMLVPHPPKRHFVRKLIDTFSQGADGRPGKSRADIPPHIRKSKRNGNLLLSEVNQGGLVTKGNNNNSWPDSRDEMDVDSLPPPPPEVLMDNSFQSTDSLPGNSEGAQENSGQTLPPICQKTGLSQRLKASMQNMDVLPNRTTLKQRATAVTSARPVRQDAIMALQDAEQQPKAYVDPEIKKANCLFQQARKIIHLRNSVESSNKNNYVNSSSGGPVCPPARVGQSHEANDFYEGEMATCTHPVIAPPVSRARLPPSCLSVSHRYPSPPVVRPQSFTCNSSRPSSPRTVTRAIDCPPEEIVPSVSFKDARSVFCQNESQNSQAPGSCTLPRRFGEASRGRASSRETDGSTRRTQSEQRTGVLNRKEFSRDGSLSSSRAKGKEPAVTSYRSGSPVMSGDDDQ